MPQPTNYTPTTDFSQQEANNASGRSAVNTAALDAEFANIETTLDQTLSNLQLIQRDDGRLGDVTVEVRCLAPDVLNIMGGFNLTGLWTPATAYAVNDICSNGEYTYVCKTAHTSGGSFSATNWVQFGFTSGADAAQAAANAQASAAAALVSENNSSGHASSASASASASASSAASAASSASSATSSASAASSSATNAANSASAAAASAASAVTLTGTQTLQNKTLDGTNSLSGNLRLTGTGARITGDFSNATTIANRVMFQTSTVGGNTIVGAIPNGAGNTASFNAYNASDPTNASFAQISLQGADARFSSGMQGSGTYLPMTFYTGGSERMRIDTGGNVGIGAVPAASQGSLQSYIPIPGGAPAASGSTDANQMAAIKGGSIQLSVGAYLSGAVWLQARQSSNFAINTDLRLNPNGGNVIHKSTAKAWVNFDGKLSGTITPRANLNIASVTKNGTGAYTLNIAAGVLADANYVICGTVQRGDTNDDNHVAIANAASPTTTACQVTVVSSGVANDASIICATIFGN